MKNETVAATSGQVSGAAAQEAIERPNLQDLYKSVGIAAILAAALCQKPKKATLLTR